MNEWNPRANAVFLQALACSDTSAQQQLLDRECGNDHDLRIAVETLLRAYQEATGFLEAAHPAAIGVEQLTRIQDTNVQSPPEVPEEQSKVGRLIAGRYELIEPLGEGSMGTVWVANQNTPVRRRVAVKLIRTNRADCKMILARFTVEQQAIALMDHPNIAKLLDAGTSEQGSPFFVMELVNGGRLTEFCDGQCLPIRERLMLFTQVCRAVQHAHQKGIIHRDLKPSNILVESHEGVPIPKVIDFGLAKAIGGVVLTDWTLSTKFGDVLGTPLYMAPEQASSKAADIDTRADIFALGVILYELLTGVTPLSSKEVNWAALDEVLRAIREQEPQAPSRRLGTLEQLSRVAANRATEPGKLCRLVKDELDWVVVKAMANERERRYASVGEFAADIERFLNHEPVVAGPPSWSYRVRKFARRNRPQVIAVTAVLLVLIGGVVGTTWGMIAAQYERDAKDQARKAAEDRLVAVDQANDLLASIFAELDPRRIKAGESLQLLLGKQLDKAVAELDTQAIADPLTVARLRNRLGWSMRSLGYPAKAIPLLRKALRTQRIEQATDHPETLLTMSRLARAYLDIDQTTKGLQLAKEALEQQVRVLGPAHRDTIISRTILFGAYRSTGQRAEAIQLAAETLQLAKKHLGLTDPESLVALNNLGVAYGDANQPNKALPYYEEAFRLQTKALGPQHIDSIIARSNLSVAYGLAGHIQKALRFGEKALHLARENLGPTHPNTLQTMNNLSIVYRDAGRLPEAIRLLEQTVKIRTATPASRRHALTLLAIGNLAAANMKAGRTQAGLQRAEEALQLTVEKYGSDHSAVDEAKAVVCRYSLAAGEPDRGLPYLSEFVRTLETQFQKADGGSPQRISQLAVDGQRLVKYGQFAEAEKILRWCFDYMQKTQPDHWFTFFIMYAIGKAVKGQGNYDAAEPLLLEGYHGMKARGGAIPAGALVIPQALDDLIDLYQAMNRPDEVTKYQELRALVER